MEKIHLNRIAIVLKEEKVKNKELAAKLGVSAKQVSRWCTNKGQPSLRLLYRIAEALKINLQRLVVETIWPNETPSESEKNKKVVKSPVKKSNEKG